MSDLSGEDFSNGLFLQPAPKRGFPTGINDATLHAQRDSLVWHLENNWGEVGWELGQATTIEHIRIALAPLQKGTYHPISLFLRRSTSVVKSAQLLRVTRRECGEVVKRLRAAYDVEKHCRESCDRGTAALYQSIGTQQQVAIEQEHARRTASLKAAEERLADLQQQDRALRVRLDDEEAGFAQRELLRFILNQRYTFSPLRFANAMAGLPYMGYRQSSTRCAPWDCQLANGRYYREFKIISAALLKSTLKSKSIAERIRSLLQTNTKPGNDAASELKKNWYYLQAAIQRVEAEEHVPDSLPFRIMAEFQRRSSSRTAVDLILEEEAQLW